MFTPAFTQRFSANAATVLTLAKAAVKADTFGVGAVMVDPAGAVIAMDRNRLWPTAYHANPTAHAEMGVMRNYYQRRHQGEDLPPPEQCTIISSLDPCIMCAGAVMQGNFKQISLSHDPHAGVSRFGSNRYITLPAALRKKAERSFAITGVTDGPRFFGDKTGIPPQNISRTMADAAFDLFYRGSQRLGDRLRQQRGWGIRVQENPEQMPLPMQDRLRSLFSDSLALTTDPDNPGGSLLYRLRALANHAKADGHQANAAALVHPSGHVLLAVSGREAEVPLDTPLMRLTRLYDSARGDFGKEGFAWLPSRATCTVVTFHDFDASPTGVMEIGMLRSQAFHVTAPSAPRDLARVIAALPINYGLNEETTPRQVAQPPVGASCMQPECQHGTRSGLFTRLIASPSA